MGTFGANVLYDLYPKHSIKVNWHVLKCAGCLSGKPNILLRKNHDDLIQGNLYSELWLNNMHIKTAVIYGPLGDKSVDYMEPYLS